MEQNRKPQSIFIRNGKKPILDVIDFRKGSINALMTGYLYRENKLSPYLVPLAILFYV
jgi:hypothetical protein